MRNKKMCRNKKRVLGAIVMATVILTATGCGSNSNDTTTASDSVEQVETEIAEPSAESDSGETDDSSNEDVILSPVLSSESSENTESSTRTEVLKNTRIDTAEDLMEAWGDMLEHPEDWTSEECQLFTSAEAHILNNRSQEEKQADYDADGVVGYDVRYEDSGLSYLVDVLTGKEYHFGDMTPEGVAYQGQGDCDADRLKRFKTNNPNWEQEGWTDEQILDLPI
jgi:hypothetical protein